MIIINPGTEKQNNATLENAVKAAEFFMEDLGLKGFTFTFKSDKDGWFDFVFEKGDFKMDVTFPGSDPETTRLGKPWESPRIYVDGSSWLWGYGLGIFADKYKDYLMEQERIK